MQKIFAKTIKTLNHNHNSSKTIINSGANSWKYVKKLTDCDFPSCKCADKTV